MRGPPDEPSDPSLSELRERPDEPSAAELRRAKAAVMVKFFPDQPGARVDGRYVLRGLVGHGGLGAVYRADDTELERTVAIKFLRERADAVQGAQDLRKEAQVLARLQHPNIVTVYDVARADGALYLTMELIDGDPLDVWLSATSRSWREVVQVFRQAVSGLVAAHAAGVIHRDFKPSNVMVGCNGRVRVVDFGLASKVESPTRDEDEDSDGGPFTRVAGTRQYMAPEQFAGRPTAASDQFAVCTSLYEALVGERLWGQSEERGFGQYSDAKGPEHEMRRRGIPRWLRSVVLRGLRTDPGERFGSMEQLRASLEPPRRWAPVAVRGVLVVGGLGWSLAAYQNTASDPCLGRGKGASLEWPERRSVVAANAANAVLVAAVDEYVERWEQLDRASCQARESGEITPVLDALRQRCLRRRRHRIDHLLSVVLPTTANPGALADAARSVAETAQCQQDDRLLDRAPPADYDAGLGERLMQAIDEAYVHARLGDLRTYAMILAKARRSIKERGRALPEELLLDQRYGEALALQGRFEDAEAVLLPAMLTAQAQRNWPADVGTIQSLLAVALSQQDGRAREASMLADLAIASATDRDDHGAMEMVAQNAKAIATRALGDIDQALVASARAVELEELTRRAGWVDGSSVPMNSVEALGIRAQVLVDAGDAESAALAYERALTVAGEIGYHGVIEARLQNNLAALVEAREPVRADALREASAATKLREGLEEDAAMSLMNLGNGRLRRGDLAGAVAAYTKAEALLPAAASEARLNVGYNTALAFVGQRQWAAANQAYAQVIEVAAQLSLSDDHPLIFPALVGFGSVLLEMGERSAAMEVMSRAYRAETEGHRASDRTQLRLGLAQLAEDPVEAAVLAKAGLLLAPPGEEFAELRRELTALTEK